MYKIFLSILTLLVSLTSTSHLIAQNSADYYYQLTQENFADTKYTPQRTRSMVLYGDDPNEIIEFSLNHKLYRNLEVLQLMTNNITVLDTVWQNLPNLKMLRINNTDLKTMPKNIVLATNISYLDLENNKLTEIPYHLAALPHLIALDLGSTLYGGNQISIIDERILQFKSLKSLMVSQNPIDSICPAFCLLKELVVFNCTQTKLKTLPTNFGKLHQLKSLRISSNPLLTKLPPTFAALDSLVQLDIAYLPNCVSLNNYDFINNFKQLKVIDLSLPTAKVLPKQLYNLTALTHLNIYGADKLDFESTIAQLKQIKNLQYALFLSHNYNAKQQSIFNKKMFPVEIQFVN